MLNRKRNEMFKTAVALGCMTGLAHASGFQSPNDLVLLQANGDGGGYGESVTLTDFSISRTVTTNASGGTTISLGLNPANTINLPTTGLSYNGSSNNGLTEPGINYASHAGQLTLSQDGHSLVFPTYLTPVGPVLDQGYAFPPDDVDPTTAPRVVTVLGSDGSLDSSTQLTGASDYNSVDMRQVTSLDGTQFFSVGNGSKPYGSSTDIGGIRFSTKGASSTTTLNIGTGIDARTATIYQGQMYVAGGSANNPTSIHTLSQLGTGLNTTTPQNWTPLPANTTSGNILGNQSPSFITLNNGVSVVYESDSTSGALEKWTLINGVWNFSTYYIAFGKDQIENITARLNSDNSVTLFSDNNTGGLGSVYAYTDVGGAGPMNLSGASLTTVGQSTYYQPGNAILTAQQANGNSPAFYGLSFAPSASAAVSDQIWGNLNGVNGSAGGSWSTQANWSAAIPNASGTTATFGPGLTSNASGGIITLDGSKTVGHLEFNDSAVNYTLLPGSDGTLTIDNTDPNSTGLPSIFNSNGNQTISVPINLANGVTIASHYQDSLIFTTSISGAGAVQVYGPGALTLSGSNNYSGDTIIHSGPVVVTATGSLPTTTNLTVGDPADTLAVGLTASLLFNASIGSTIRPITLSSLSILSNGTVTLAKPASIPSRSVLVTGSLTFTGSTGAWTGQLDLSSNDAVIHTGVLSTITNQITQGFNGGTWNGIGAITSTVAASDTTHLTALGVIQNNQSGTPLFTAAHPFDGIIPGVADDLIKYTYSGDANLDGKVDGSDYTRIDFAYTADKTNPTLYTGWYNGDFNYDGIINGSDYTLIDNAFNRQTAVFTNELAAPTAQIGSSAVPEPTSIGITLVAALGLLGRRKR